MFIGSLKNTGTVNLLKSLPILSLKTDHTLTLILGSLSHGNYVLILGSSDLYWINLRSSWVTEVSSVFAEETLCFNS